jgi:hypothetical protein
MAHSFNIHVLYCSHLHSMDVVTSQHNRIPEHNDNWARMHACALALFRGSKHQSLPQSSCTIVPACSKKVR